MVICTESSGTRYTDQPIRYPFHYGPWGLRLMKLMPGVLHRSAVELSPNSVRVWGITRRIVIPRAAIVRVWQVKPPDDRFSVRLLRLVGLPGRYGDALWMNSSWDNLVEIDMDPPRKVRRWRLPTAVRRVIVSVDDPDGLIGALLG